MNAKLELKQRGWCLLVATVAGVVVLGAAEVLADVPSVGVIHGAAGLGHMEEISTTGSCLRMLGALCFCLGIFAGGIQLYRRYAGVSRIGSRRRLAVHEKLPLTSKSSLLLVSLDGREFLVSSGSDRVHFIPTPKVSDLEFGDSLDDACGQSEVFDV